MHIVKIPAHNFEWFDLAWVVHESPKAFGGFYMLTDAAKEKLNEAGLAFPKRIWFEKKAFIIGKAWWHDVATWACLCKPLKVDHDWNVLEGNLEEFSQDSDGWRIIGKQLCDEDFYEIEFTKEEDAVLAKTFLS